MRKPTGYSHDTEILTRHSGWVTFDQLRYLDEVATRSPGAFFEWQHVRRIQWKPYEGFMMWFHGRSLDLLVTPDHPMLYVLDPRSAERIDAAGTLLSRATRLKCRPRSAAFLPATSCWVAPDLAEYIFPGVRRGKTGPKPLEIRMSGDQYAAFMGMYIAEGCVVRTNNAWGIDICQMVGGKGYEEYRALLIEIIGREPGRCGGQWRWYSRALYEYFKPLGKALTKWLPAAVMDLSRRQLEIFWLYYFLGDGNYERHASSRGIADQQVVATGSRILAGQLQEIIQKLGYAGSMREYRHRNNALVNATGSVYKIRRRTTLFPSCAVNKIPYSGMVGTVGVPNGVVYVRRDGKPAWSGT